MMKRKLSQMLIALVLTALLVVPAMAQNLANHVTVAPNYKGDLLIYPVYGALDGLDTNFTVINTSDTQSTVVKVVFRSWKNSLELLDFLIYLSPNDVFKCTLSYDGTGYAMTTTDDSLCVFTKQTPTTYYLNTANLCPDDMAAIGYVEMFESKSYNLPKVKGVVPKQNIIDAYVADVAAGALPTIADTPNIITGYAEMVMPGADYADYQATALENYDNLDLLTIPVETLIGTGANNTRCEVEAALAKTNLVIPYFTTGVGTIPLVTFPTKLTQDLDCNPVNRFSTSPFFSNFFTPSVHMAMYDLEENTTSAPGCTHSPCDKAGPDPVLPDEVNLLVGMQYPFAEGWSRFSFAQNTACQDKDLNAITFGGAPAVPLVFEWSANGLSILPVAFDYGTVTYNRVNVTRMYQTGAAVADVAPVCDANHLNLCAAEADCTGAGGNWCDGACQAAACAAPTACGDNTTEADCTGDCVWQSFPSAACILNCAQFTDQATCEAGLNSGCQWNQTAFGDVCAPK